MGSIIMSFEKRTAENIKKLRKKLNISVDELSEYLDVDGSFIRSVECGNAKYNLRHIYLIKDLFNKYDKTIMFENLLPKRSDGLIRNLQKRGKGSK